MGTAVQALMHHLRMHVEQLSGKIGERNFFCPTALQAAASYIEHEWQQQGYAVRRIAYNGLVTLSAGLPFRAFSRNHR
jgi:hypothetical protein